VTHEIQHTVLTDEQVQASCTCGASVIVGVDPTEHAATMTEAVLEQLATSALAPFHREPHDAATTAWVQRLRTNFEETCRQLGRVQEHLQKTGLARLGESWVDTVLPRLVSEHQDLREIARAAQREELRHIREIDAEIQEMPPQVQEFYRMAHRASCDLAGVLALHSAVVSRIGDPYRHGGRS
jgi:hypothetical protein